MEGWGRETEGCLLSILMERSFLFSMERNLKAWSERLEVPRKEM